MTTPEQRDNIRACIILACGVAGLTGVVLAILVFVGGSI